MGHLGYGRAVSRQQGEAEPEGYPVAMKADGTEGLVFAPVSSWGWAVYFADTEVVAQAGSSAPPWVFVRFARQSHGQDYASAPIELRQFRFQADEGAAFESAPLRSIPFRRMEAAVNRSVHAPALHELVPASYLPMDVPGQDDRVRAPDGELQMLSRWLVRQRLAPPVVPELRIEIPSGTRRPDDFYAQVGDRFLWLASTTNRPVEALAEANGVPTTTVHRWVREAKTRGLLQLPTKGRLR